MGKSKPPRITGTDNVRYLRVSSVGQVNTEYNPEGISLPAQREACVSREHDLGSVNVREFIEPGKSAKSIEQRPAFQEMITYLKANPNVRYVSTYALSRFARNQYEDAIMMVTLERLGVELISATERNLDNTPAGRAMHGMLAVFNEYQVTASGLDIKYKMGQKVIKHGGTLGPAKLGYLNETVRVDGHKVNTIVVDPDRASYIPMAFELYATGKYNFHTLREALTEAGLRTKGNRRYGPRPISINKVGQLLQDRYYLGYVTYDGVEHPGRHEPLVTPELFERVQRVLYSERKAGIRQRTHNHYLKGLLWCDRCQRRLMIIPGKSKTGTVYFYYICRGRQDHTCDLPYLHVSKLERVVENHYATVRLSEDFCSRLRAMMSSTKSSARSTAKRLRDQLAKQFAELDLQEDRYLDLVGHPDWPKEKLSAKMRAIRDEKARVQERLETTENPIDSGYEVLETVLRLLEDPLELYRTAKQRARKVLNKAIFGKLYIDADEQGPFVASDELNEPFETVLMGRRESSFSEALAKAERARLSADTSPDQALADLLNSVLTDQSSSKAAMVGRQGVEP
jgi:DNA invertase Pin-like site-specific DNA recombinase